MRNAIEGNKEVMKGMEAHICNRYILFQDTGNLIQNNSTILDLCTDVEIGSSLHKESISHVLQHFINIDCT